MSAKTKHIIYLKALFPAIVFLYALVAKPVHVLLEHSHKAEIIAAHSESDLFLRTHHSDCDICDFEFATFLQNEIISLPATNFVLLHIYEPKPVPVIYLKSCSNTQLRAPPAA